MKLSVAICSFLIASLTILPAINQKATNMCSEDMTCTKICHKKEKPDKGKSNENKNCSEGCNPFIACASGNFFLIPIKNNDVLKIFLLQERVTAFNNNSTFGYISECWHPPEHSFA